MKIEVQDVSEVKKTMTIEVPAEMVEHERDHVLRGYASQANIPGFRKGKAPLSVISGRFAKEVADDVRERVLTKAYAEAAKEKGFSPIADPTLDEVNDEEGSFSFTTTFEVLPKIELKDYKGLDVEARKLEVEDAEIDKTLEEIRQSRTQMVTEEGRKASTGDVVVCDIHGTPEEGEVFDRERMMIEVGQTDNLPAFNEQLEGVTAGDEKSFTVEYPKEYPAEELAGTSVAYEIKVHEVKRREVPELDDEFAKDLGEFDDLAALKARIREDLEHRQKHEIEGETRNKLVESLLEAHPISLPEVLVEHEIRGRLEELVRNLMQQGMDPEKAGLDWKEIREKQEEPARKSVHARLVLDEIAKAESIEVTPDEFQQRIQRDAASMGQKPEDVLSHLDKGPGRQVIVDQLLREKSLDLVQGSANIRTEE